MTTVANEGKKFVTVAARFQVNPAAIVDVLAKKFPVPHQQKAAFLRAVDYFRRVWPPAFVLRCAGVILKKNFQGVARLDSSKINQYFVPATCTFGCKPEEARRPGSVFEDPYPTTTHHGVRRRDGTTRGVLSCRLQGLNPLGCHQKRPQSDVSQGEVLLVTHLLILSVQFCSSLVPRLKSPLPFNHGRKLI